MNSKQEYKKEVLERIFNGEKKQFNIEKVTLSDDDPIIQRARAFLRERNPEEIERYKRDLKYPGLLASRSQKPKRKLFRINIGLFNWS